MGAGRWARFLGVAVAVLLAEAGVFGFEVFDGFL